MDQLRINYLLERYMIDAATPEEQKELTALLKKDTHRDMINTLLLQKMAEEVPRSPVMTEAWAMMPERILEIDKAERPAAGKMVWLFRRAAVAAAVLAICVGGYFGMRRMGVLSGRHDLALRQKTISTGRGHRAEAIVLPDGSRVWLNAASSIRYDSVFGDRSIVLRGEAFFEVSHAGGSPFVIHTGRLTTTVLGTSFDIEAYEGGQSSIVSVQTGKVSVQAGPGMPVLLQSGGQVRVNADSSVIRQGIDKAGIAAWREGRLSYKDERVSEIVADLERVFDGRIRIGRADVSGDVITVSFDRNAGLQAALDMICRITDAKLAYSEGTYIIQ